MLIVGAGPVGLFLACDLLQRGVSVRLIDELKEPSIYSKALWIHTRTMEALATIDVAEAVEQAAVHGRGLRLFKPGMTQAVADIDLMVAKEDTRYPYVFCLQQRETEALLTRRLHSLGGSVERGVKLVELSERDGRVHVKLGHADGSEELAQFDWVAGCDGARSTVRKQVGLSAEGKTYESTIVQGDVHIRWPMDVPADLAVGIFSSESPIIAFPLPQPHRYRLIVTEPNGIESFEYLRDALTRVGPSGVDVSDPLWVVKFTVHCRMVGQYRVGRVFVAGDAAHMHSPAGGQGMNTGIQDAWNLGWKLAGVIQGRLSERILDTYGAERIPVARAVLAGSDLAFSAGTSALRGLPKALIDLRDNLLHFVTSLDIVREMASRTISELDIGYPGSPLSVQSRGPLMETHLKASAADENPTLRDWFHYGDGPAPGLRVPDVQLTGVKDRDGTSQPQRVYDLLGPRSTLFLFDGASSSQAGYERLLSIARDVTARCRGMIRPLLVVPHTEVPAIIPSEVEVVLDGDASLHRAFGVRSESIYLVRPDRYVGFRSIPAQADALERYVSEWFINPQ